MNRKAERMESPDRAPMERAVVSAFPYLAGGLLVSPLLLLVATPAEPLAHFTVQLGALVALGLAVVIALAALGDGEWFTGFEGWSAGRRTFLGAVVLVAIPTGVTALVTLASSAALRFSPSLQFLQLLSALDIAWAAAALMLGVRWLWGTRVAVGAGLGLGVACVASVWNYLRVVGFGPDGEWIVDGERLLQLVLPFDAAAAVVALAALVSGVHRRASQVTEQASVQSYG